MGDSYSTSYPESSQAVLALVLGILGLLICQVLGPFAWIIGNSELRAIAEGRRPPNDRGLAQAGRVLGIIGTVLLVLGIVFFLGFLVLAGVGIFSGVESGAFDTATLD